VNGVYSLIHIILMFFIWSGKHKFYVQCLRRIWRRIRIRTYSRRMLMVRLYLGQTHTQVLFWVLQFGFKNMRTLFVKCPQSCNQRICLLRPFVLILLRISIFSVDLLLIFLLHFSDGDVKVLSAVTFFWKCFHAIFFLCHQILVSTYQIIKLSALL
jgi:hypothetical protein